MKRITLVAAWPVVHEGRWRLRGWMGRWDLVEGWGRRVVRHAWVTGRPSDVVKTLVCVWKMDPRL